MLIIITSFVPVFLLTGQEGKMFTPLAWTKTLTMVGASVLAITLVPVLLVIFLKGKLRPDKDNPISQFFVSLYTPVLRLVLRRPVITLLIAVGLVGATVPLLTGIEFDTNSDGEKDTIVEPIGSEFMPALDEGSILYMPVTLPNVSVTEAKRLLQLTDKIIAEHPEAGFVAAHDYKEFAAALQKPRTALIMVKAGRGTDAVIDELSQRTSAS
jgi:Cu(I)/Ag(I) efflux system membrane protein CusA/SilA